MFGGQFGVSQTGAEDGLRSTSVDFLSNKSAPAKIERKQVSKFYTTRLPEK
jgi:hypothetical protein